MALEVIEDHHLQALRFKAQSLRSRGVETISVSRRIKRHSIPQFLHYLLHIYQRRREI